MLPLLIQHEARLKQEEEEDDSKKQTSMAFYGRSKQNFQKGFQKRSSGESSRGGGLKCFTCGQTGHRSTDCDENPHRSHKCNKCGKEGHIKANCRSKDSNEQGEGRGFKKTLAFSVLDAKGHEESWLLDSGALAHLTGDLSKFVEIGMVKNGPEVEFGNEGLLKVAGFGTVEIVCETPTGFYKVLLKRVRCVPGVGVNLASLGKFLDGGAKVAGEGKVVSLEQEGKVFLQAVNHEDILVIHTAKPAKVFSTQEDHKAKLWHRRFGHASYESLARMALEDLVEGMPVKAEKFRQAKTPACEPCIMGKQVWKPIPDSSRQTDKSLHLVHMDLCGPMQEMTPGGNRYFLSFTDDFSRCSTIQLLKVHKNQASKAIETFVMRAIISMGRL
jgi:hypothetical protein